MSVQVGDWVTTYSPGIWRVVRILQNVEPLHEHDRGRNQVFAARFLTGSGKPGFRTESCDALFVQPLAAEQRALLDAFIRDNPKALQRFEACEPRLPDLIYNLRTSTPADELSIPSAIEGGLPEGMTLPQIRAALEAEGMASAIGRNPTRATLQFVSPEHEVRDRHFVFRKVNILPF